jgi:serine protease Do
MAESSDGTDRLGLMVEPVEGSELRTLRLRGGVSITRVSPDSVGAEAMLRAGDIIVQLGYSRIDDFDEYNQVIAELPTDTPVAIRFYRQGRAIFRTIEITE